MSLTVPSPAPDRASTIPQVIDTSAAPVSVRGDQDSLDAIVTHAFAAETVGVTEQHVYIRCHGELDIAIARELRSFLTSKLRAGNNVMIDVSGLTFLDTAGLASLLGSIDFARDHCRHVSFIGPLQPQVRRLLELTGAGSVVGQQAA